MGKLTVKTGSTSRLEHVFILDSTSTTGSGKTGLTNASVTMHFFRPADTTVTPVTLSAGTLGTWTTGGFKEVSATDMPGVYEIGMPNAVFATTFNHSVVMIKGTGIAPVVLEYNLVSYDPLDTVRLGLTAIPNVAQGTVGSLPTATATGQVTVATNNDKSNYTLTVTPPTAAAISTQVWSETTRLLTAGTNIALAKGTGITGFNDITVANVWDALETSITTASSIGLKLKTNLDAAVSTRMATFTYTAPPTAATISTQVWTEPIPGTFGAGSAGAKLNSASSAGDPWNTAVPGSYAAGTAGFILGTNLNATITSRMATFTYTAPPTVAQIWQTDVSGFSTVGQAGTYLKNAMPTFTYTAPLTSGQTASAVWDALLASYTVNNSFGQRVLRSTTSQSACAVTGANHIAADVHELQPAVITAADFSANAIDANALAANAATEIAVATLNTDVSSYPSPTAGYAMYQGLIEAGLAKAFAEQMTQPLYQQSMADYLLGRNIAGGSSTGRLVKEALYALRNKSEIVGSTLNVYNATDGAIAWTAAVSSSGSAVPVTGIDPV